MEENDGRWVVSGDVRNAKSDAHSATTDPNAPTTKGPNYLGSFERKNALQTNLSLDSMCIPAQNVPSCVDEGKSDPTENAKKCCMLEQFRELRQMTIHFVLTARSGRKWNRHRVLECEQ